MKLERVGTWIQTQVFSPYLLYAMGLPMVVSGPRFTAYSLGQLLLKLSNCSDGLKEQEVRVGQASAPL